MADIWVEIAELSILALAVPGRDATAPYALGILQLAGVTQWVSNKVPDESPQTKDGLLGIFFRGCGGKIAVG